MTRSIAAVLKKTLKRKDDFMTRLVRSIPAAAIAVLALIAGSAAPGGAAPRTACALVPAAQASALFARAVTTVDRPNPVSAGSSTCMYISGRRPIMQLALTVAESQPVAQTMFKLHQHAEAGHKNIGSRQKGNIVLSAIAMNGDGSMLDALLDAAAKNL